MVKNKTLSNRLALKHSIEHWNKMIEWVKTQPEDHKAIDIIMFKAIKTDWYGKNCFLCKRFKQIKGCVSICPVIKEYGSCEDMGWHKVNSAKTWKEWLEYAQILVSKLELLLEKSIKQYRRISKII
jgi:hypothetical protein